MNRPELYKTLGVSDGASVKELKSAFRRFAKRYHPDTTPGKRNSEIFSWVSEAYQALIRRQRDRRAFTKSIDIFELGNMLISDGNPSRRVFAARSLGFSRKRCAYAFLRKGLNDRNEMVVRSVVKAIGNLHICQSAGELGALLLRSSSEIKLLILDTVGGLGHGFNNILIAGMKDGDLRVRRKAVHIFSLNNG